MDDDIPELVEELPSNGEVKYESRNIADTNKNEKNSQENDEQEKPIKKKIPISIVTGYLGSGKSTLLEQIGKKSNLRLAIILNEFGDTSQIEKAVTIQDQNDSVQEWLDLGNGCLCCTVKDNGVTAIENLIENSRGKIDYILLETTGVADPAPIAKMFWLDDGLSSSVYIDSVITVVDSENIEKCLDDFGGHWHRENDHINKSEDLTEEEIEQEDKRLQEGITTAHLQIALADVILVNKVDRVNEKQIQNVCQRLEQINSTAPTYPTSFGDISLDKILNLHSFEVGSKLMNKSTFHDGRISTVAINFPFFTSISQFDQVEKFLQFVLWENEVMGKKVEIHRVKGILVHENDVRVIQGVRDTYDIILGGKLVEDIKENKIVFIGKNLNETDLLSELKNYLA